MIVGFDSSTTTKFGKDGDKENGLDDKIELIFSIHK